MRSDQPLPGAARRLPPARPLNWGIFEKINPKQTNKKRHRRRGRGGGDSNAAANHSANPSSNRQNLLLLTLAESWKIADFRPRWIWHRRLLKLPESAESPRKASREKALSRHRLEPPHSAQCRSQPGWSHWGRLSWAGPAFGRYFSFQRNTLITHTPKTPCKQSDSSVVVEEEEPVVM